MDEELRLTGRTGVMHARSEVCEEDIGLSYGHARICRIGFAAEAGKSEMRAIYKHTDCSGSQRYCYK